MAKITYPSFRFTEPFCSKGEKTVPPVQQTATGNGRTSLETGFPPECQKPISAGGLPPERTDFNGVLNALSQWSAWQGVGGVAKWDKSIEYDRGQFVAHKFSSGWVPLWQCVTPNKGVEPSDGSPYWVRLSNKGDIDGWVSILRSEINGVKAHSDSQDNITRRDYVIADNNVRDSFKNADDQIRSTLSNEVAQLRREINALRVGFVGEIVLSSTLTPPRNSILCDGRSLNASDYSELFGKIGYTWGGSQGRFNVPNLVDKFPEGTNSAVGQYLQAGLPNVTGEFFGSPCGTVNGAFGRESEGKNSGISGGGSSCHWQYGTTFNASSSNPIYGRSSTVQPEAAKIAFFIRY